MTDRILPFPTLKPQDLPQRNVAQSWLIDALWGNESVGIVGGEPKCCKSFLALEMAVSVASATACLQRFSVPRPGKVLLFAAEDALHIVRSRLAALAAHRQKRLDELALQVITSPTMRIDLQPDRDRLYQTVMALEPTLLILDPFVRLHRRDENISSEVAPLLAYLRELQRQFALAVIVVHHAKKGGAKIRGGQALRGSSEFHAWGDSNLYLRRHGSTNRLTLSVEHRAAQAIAPLDLKLIATKEQSVTLAICDDNVAPADSPKTKTSHLDRVRAALALAPLSAAQIRSACAMKNQHVYQALTQLKQAGQLVQSDLGYALLPSSASSHPLR